MYDPKPPKWEIAGLRKMMRRRHKYNAKKVEIDGYKFDSKREAQRYRELKLLGYRGLIVHPVFLLEHNGVAICKVILDFQYLEGKGNGFVYEDIKGVDTPVSRLKRKLLKAFHGIDVRVIK